MTTARAPPARALAPPRDDLVAILAVGLIGTLWRTPPGAGVEHIPDGVKITGLQGERDSFGEPGRLSRRAGIVHHEDLPCTAQLAIPA